MFNWNSIKTHIVLSNLFSVGKIAWTSLEVSKQRSSDIHFLVIIYKCNRIPSDMMSFLIKQHLFIYFSSPFFYPAFLTCILLQPLRESILILWCAAFLIWQQQYLFTIAKLETYSHYVQVICLVTFYFFSFVYLSMVVVIPLYHNYYSFKIKLDISYIKS